MKIKKEEYEWCIALENVGVYDNSTFGSVPLFFKGELATKEKVFSYIPDMTEEKYSKLFRPATEEEINGESDYKRINNLSMKCPKCGYEMVGEVIATNPPKYEEKCPNCGYREGGPINDLPTGSPGYYIQSSLDFEIEQKWNDLRHQAAIAAMQGLMLIHRHDSYEIIARIAVEQADALIKELRKGK